MARQKYNHSAIEKDAQEKWESLNLYTTDLEQGSNPYYLLLEFPYPSGDLHVGHWYAYSAPDIFARFKRMQGFTVLFPFGFDAFGLPAENAAIKRGLDPRKWTYENMASMTRQVKTIGSSLDWSKSFATCDPEYYRWTQWLFSRLYENDLAYRGKALVNWDPIDLTVLANEQVLPDGTAERSGGVVEKKELEQWFMRITKYADRLIADLDDLPWREEIKIAQKSWIGKSEGAKIPFTLAHKDGSNRVDVFTTRPDTLYGVTYLVLAPELALITSYVENGLLSNAAEVKAYVSSTKSKTDRDRMQSKEKTGVRLEGIMALHPLTGEKIPVYISDYVLASYGTGVVMAVPAHDERDFAFATLFKLPIVSVIDPVTGTPQKNAQPKSKIVAFVENEKNEVLTIHWKPELGGRLLIGGTIDGTDQALETALREIQEETGYCDVALISQAPETIHHSYYAHSKQKAFDAKVTIFHFKLRSEVRTETALEENERGKFVVEWVPLQTALHDITDPLHRYALERFSKNKQYVGNGLLAHSAEFTGRSNTEVTKEIVAKAGGEMTTNYRLRDWLISRQRYWGCPIPVVYDPEGNPHLVPDEHLPWLLPDDVDFTPGMYASPLMSSIELKERVIRIFGVGWTPEYDTLDTFVDSSWYFMRYLSPKDTVQFADVTMMEKWMPVDRYSGGSEHTTLHLLYARFFTKALFDLGLVPTSEPFIERFNRGLIADGEGKKMSKSKGNVVNPDDPVQEFGADAVRMYLAFIGPYNEPGTYPWKPSGVEAMRKFLDRIYNLRENIDATAEVSIGEQRAVMKAAERMAKDIERFKLNTAVSALMILMNELETQPVVSVMTYKNVLILLAPFAPHLSEHLFNDLLPVEKGSVHQQPWPKTNETLVSSSTVTLGVQISGKRRGEVTISARATEEEALAAARSVPTIATHIGEKQPSRIVYISGKVFNIIP
jgi:leucyl-tRNA synthetase